MLDEIRVKIEAEIARLTEELTRELPIRIKTAMEHRRRPNGVRYSGFWFAGDH